VRIQAFIAAVATMPSLANAAAVPVHLAPSSPWAVDYAENSCRLIRHFGEGEDKTILALESEAPGSLDMMIVSKRVDTFAEQAWARFLPLQSKLMDGMTARSTDKRTVPVLLFSNVELLTDDSLAAEEKRQTALKAHRKIRPPAVSLTERAERKADRQTFAAGTTAIELYPSRNHPVILDTGSLGEPIKIFDRCSRDSLRDWGVDPDVDDKIVRPVWAPDPAAWFDSADYPRRLVVAGEESVVKVRVLVDATGHVTKCTSLSHFEESEFNKITCDKFTSRAHFEPAELADGTKVPSYYVTKVIFRIAQ
jgi:hypothetical protein